MPRLIIFPLYLRSEKFYQESARRSVILNVHCAIGSGEHVLRETGEIVDNGFSEIYVNARVKDGSLTADLMTIFTENDAYDEKNFPAVSKRKRYFKEEEEGVSEMCEIMEEIREDGRREGRQEGRIQLMVQMYRDGDISLQKACERLGCSEEEFLQKEKYFAE